MQTFALQNANYLKLNIINVDYMPVKERIREFIKYKEISERLFCRKIGVSSTYVNSIRESIQPDKIQSISMQFPELNAGWLLTGEGEMLKSNSACSNAETAGSISIPREVFDHIARLTETVLSQQRTIESLTVRQE
jgi:hypothetical protein